MSLSFTLTEQSERVSKSHNYKTPFKASDMF